MSGNNELFSIRYFDDQYRELYDWKNTNGYEKKAIYGCSIRIKEQVNINKFIYVIEMDNTNNRILGISRIKNRVWRDKIYNIHQHRRYNRIIYRGKYRIDCSDFMDEELYFIHILEDIMFYGKDHIKRGRGIQELPTFMQDIRDYKKYEVTEKINLKKYDNKDILIRVEQDNPKLLGTASYQRYEKYKIAKNKYEFLQLKGTNLDFNHDLNKGFISIIDGNGNIIYNSKHDYKLINFNTTKFIHSMFHSRFNIK